MDFQANGVTSAYGMANASPAWFATLWADGLDGQEDELEDVSKGKLDPPTDDEGPGSIDDKNDRGRGIESEDEDDPLVERIEDRGGSSGHTGSTRGGGVSPGDDQALDELADKAGVRLPE